MNEKDRIKKHPCTTCGINTNHEILSVESISSHDPDYHYEEKYMMLRCRGCEQISFRKESHDYESYWQIGENEWEYQIASCVYPPCLEGHRELEGIYDLPTPVRSIYNETLDSIKQGSYTLAGIGLRATVEAICNDQGVEGKNLSTRINRLSSTGVISKQDARNLQAIRFMGNDAAHDIRAAKKEAIVLALTIIEHLLETQYTLIERAERYLDLPIDNFESFKSLVGKKLWKIDKDSAFTLRGLLGHDIRRIAEYDNYENQLDKMITAGTYIELEKVELSEAQEEQKTLYKIRSKQAQPK